MARFKLLTYNIHRGRSPIRRRDVCMEVARILDFSEVDAFCLQEVWQEEGFDKHQLESHLCDLRWPHRLFEVTVSRRLGHQGNAIVSRRPIRTWRSYDVSFRRREKRSLLHALVETPDGREAGVFCVHFGLARSERRHQAELLRELVAQHVPESAPLFVAGDFNDWRYDLGDWLREKMGLTDVAVALSGKQRASYPAYFPFLSLDRIYYRNAKPVKVAVIRPDEGLRLSDHLPIEAEFEV